MFQPDGTAVIEVDYNGFKRTVSVGCRVVGPRVVTIARVFSIKTRKELHPIPGSSPATLISYQTNEGQ